MCVPSDSLVLLGNGEAFATGWDYRAGRRRVVMLGALPTARERHFAGSAHGMTTLVEAEGMTRRAPAALTGAGDAPASRDLVGVWRGFSRACWLGLQTGALESGEVLLALSLRLPAAHGRGGAKYGDL